MNILVTGANGFVGHSLLPKLIDEGHKVWALVRKKKVENNFPGVIWLEGDLLHPQDLPILPKIDVAYFLVHGLKEEKSFEYYESLTAINFVNWVRPHNPHLIYLGGLGPSKAELSPHLRSRHLTGAILGASGMDTTEFRASVILGEGSTSFEMIKALAERIPFRPEVSLLNQHCQPLALGDLLKYLVGAINLEHTGHKVLEIGASDVLTYGELLDLYCELAGIKRKHIKMPEVEARVWMKALDYAIPEHANVGKKLTESLDHPTVVTNDLAKKSFPKIRPKSIRIAMDLARSESKTHYPNLWDRDFLKMLLSDKLLVQSGLLSPELLKNLEKVGKLKDILSRGKS